MCVYVGVEGSDKVEFLMFCYEVFSVACVLHCIQLLQHVPTLSSVCVILCSIYMPDFEQEQSMRQVQVRETCFLSLPQKLGPTMASSSARIGQSIWARGMGGFSWLFSCGLEEPFCSSWSRGEFAILFKDTCWDFHKIQGFLAIRGSNAVFSQLVIFFQFPNPNGS